MFKLYLCTLKASDKWSEPHKQVLFCYILPDGHVNAPDAISKNKNQIVLQVSDFYS